MPVTKHLKPQVQNSQSKTPRSSATPMAKTGGYGFGPTPDLVERMGDVRFAAAQRQAMAAHTHQFVGNQGLTRLINGQTPFATSPIQRYIGPMLLVNTLAARQAMYEFIKGHELLGPLNQDIDAFIAETDLMRAARRGGPEETAGEEAPEPEENEAKKFDREDSAKQRDKMITNLKGLRGRIPTTVTDVNLGEKANMAPAIRQHFYLKLARVTPFYTQIKNKNILGTSSKPASHRTCNVTVIAMTLEGLGKTSADFEGNEELMKHITSQLLPGIDISALRFPDFLQIVAVYLEMLKRQGVGSLTALFTRDLAQFNEIMVQSARAAATNTSTSGDMFKSDHFYKFTKLFGVSARSYDLDFTSALTIFGGYYRPFEKEFKAYLDKKKKKKMSDEDRAAYRAEFTADRKRNALKSAQRVGKKLGKEAAALLEITTKISAIETKLEEMDKQLDEIGNEITRLEAQLAAKTVATDGTNKADWKAQQASLKADISAQTKAHRKLERQKQDSQKSLIKLQKDRDKNLAEQAKLQLQQSAYEAVGSETNEAEMVEDTLPIKVYQNAVLPLMTELLGSGKQVIVNMYNHFVKLQAITPETIIIHDPGGLARGNKEVSWEHARQMGYFRRYTVVN